MKKVIVNLMLLLCSVVISVLFAEGITKVFKLSYVLENSSDQFFESTGDIGYFGKKNIEGVWSTPEFRINIKHNSLGFRDSEYKFEKQTDIKRIVVLGDSFTWGWGVNKENIYTEKLETSLKKTEVINMGIPGYGMAKEYLLLNRYALKFKPDIVIVSFFLDDFLKKELEKDDSIFEDEQLSQQNYQALSLKDKKSPEEGKIRKINNSESISIQNFLRKNSSLYNFVATKIKISDWFSGLRELFFKLELMKRLPPVSIVATYALKNKNLWGYTEEAILKMKSLSEKHNFKLIVVIIPEKPQVYEKFWPIIHSTYNISEKDLMMPNNFIRELCEKNSINVLDLLPTFRKYADKGEKLYFDYDPHWNARGHELASEALLKYINILMR